MKKDIKPLIQSQTSRNMAAKFYTEQLPNGEDELINAVKTTSSSDRWLVAIKHTNTKDKPHWHFMDLSKETKGFNVGGELHRFGIYFRPGTDDALMKNRGLETLGSFDSYLGYVLHTDEKSQSLNKEPYSIDDMVSNLPREELQKILDGRPTKMKKLSSAEKTEIARKAGYEAKGFYKVRNTIGISGMTDTVEKGLKRAYEAGARQRMNEHIMINRLSIEIQTEMGDKDISDEKIVSAVQKALRGKELSFYSIGDYTFHLESTTDAVITKQHFNSLAKEYIQNVEAGSYGLPKAALWTGQYYIYINTIPNTKAKYKNLFVCHIEDKKLICTSSAILTGDERCMTIGEMYKDFRDRFNEALAEKDNTSKHSLKLDYLNS